MEYLRAFTHAIQHIDIGLSILTFFVQPRITNCCSSGINEPEFFPAIRNCVYLWNVRAHANSSEKKNVEKGEKNDAFRKYLTWEHNFHKEER